MRSFLRSTVAAALAGVILLSLAAPASGQVDPKAVPELVAVGTGRTAGRCFADIHTSIAWPPKESTGAWVLSMTLQVAGGVLDIRTFPSDAATGNTTRATGPGGRVLTDVVAINDKVTSYSWVCDKAPAAIEVRFEVRDGDGRTALADAIASSPFKGTDRQPGAVPDGDLVKDETGDLLAPEQGGGEDPAERAPGKGGGSGPMGALALVLLVAAMAGMGYMLWQGRDDDDDNQEF